MPFSASSNLPLIGLIVSGVFFLIYFRKVSPGPKYEDQPLWKRLHQLHARVGSVVSFKQGKTPVIALGTIKTATELLDKRGSIYSSRPRNIMAGEILSGGMRGVGMPYGTRWRNWRSLMHAGMSIEAAHNYKDLQSIETKIMLHDLLRERDVERYRKHIQRVAVSIAFCIGYGRRIASLEDPLVVAQQQVDESFVGYSTPGRYIIESWPILLNLPLFLQWFRWAPETQRKLDTELYLRLMEDVQEDLKKDIAHPSIATRGLAKQGNFGLNDLETAYALSAPFSAGVGTTTAALEVFFLAMLHYPNVMKKAQTEIDSVVGSSRMPGFGDADSLPYVNALVKETLRWRPIAPLGVPHSTIGDDEYGPTHILKGSTVIANIYSMSKDPEVFRDPEEFRPERYLEPGPHSTFFFGFGRRICPGMHVAQNSLFIVIARILWAFNITPINDRDGKPVLPSADDFKGGLVIRPSALTYTLEARSQETHMLVELAFILFCYFIWKLRTLRYLVGGYMLVTCLFK